MSSDVAELERPIAGLPANWTEITLGDIVSLEYGKSLPDKSRRPGTVPVYGSNGVVGWHDEPLVTTGGIIVGRKGTAGSVTVSTDPFWPIDTTYFVKARQTLDWDWLAATLQHARLNELNEATGVPGLNRDKAYRQNILLPPLDEQRRIAEVLRSVDDAIAAADEVICQLRETRGHRLEALMTLPGAYRRIDEICRLSGGSGFPIKHQGKVSGRYPFAKVSDMNRPGNEVQMRHAENYVDDADIRTLKAKTFPVGTTFFPKVGATLLTNKRRIAAVEMLVDNNVMGAVATDVSPWFLYYAFCTIDMADYVQPGAVPSVNQRTIGQIMIPVPDRAAQEEFVETMRDLDAAIETQSDGLVQLMAAKQALMSDLLSGRVRVPA
jgi:type I restriction enzyme S subunit